MPQITVNLPDDMDPYVDDLRYFVETMVRKLHANVHKGKWEDIDVGDAVRLMRAEFYELMDALSYGQPDEIVEEAADAANFCLIISSMVLRGQKNPFASRAAIRRPYEFVCWASRQDLDFCLVWPYKSKTGPNQEYGSISKGLSEYGRRAHRVVCAMAHGAPPSPDHHAEHLCGNTLCVNPKHLRWSTPVENQNRKREHGTIHVPKKLSVEIAREIRERNKAGESGRSLAIEFGVSSADVQKILSGRYYPETEE